VPLLHKLQANVVGIEHIAPIVETSTHLQYNGKDCATTLKGIGVNYHQIDQLVLGQGRFLNHRDEALNRPVCVIGHEAQRNLFKSENPIGKFINVGGHYFQVVGTLDKDASFNQGSQRAVFVPLQKFQKTFNQGIKFWHFRASLHAGARGKVVEDEMRSYLAEQLRFDKAAPRTLWIWNLDEQAQSFNMFFSAIRLFLWVIGISMLLSGIVGVSNMMFVLVKERTQEIGIRKVIGAGAREILMMIMTEAVFISLVSGIVGMLAGIGSIHLINQLLDYVDPIQQATLGHLVFRPSAAVAALVLLVIAGAMAGLMPARRATAILPIKALNSE
ncbi:MAG: ABC transporter permease, partial [Bacteroidota bacterium]